jgi:ankyrin repeat protein
MSLLRPVFVCVRSLSRFPRRRADIFTKLETKGLSGKIALHYAVMESREDVVKCLLRAGADLKTGDKDGMTPLHYAAKQGEGEVVQLLVSEGAEINAKAELSSGRVTALGLAANGGYMAVMEFLLKAKANTEGMDVETIRRKCKMVHDEKQVPMDNQSYQSGRLYAKSLISSCSSDG